MRRDVFRVEHERTVEITVGLYPDKPRGQSSWLAPATPELLARFR